MAAVTFDARLEDLSHVVIEERHAVASARRRNRRQVGLLG